MDDALQEGAAKRRLAALTEVRSVASPQATWTQRRVVVVSMAAMRAAVSALLVGAQAESLRPRSERRLH